MVFEKKKSDFFFFFTKSVCFGLIALQLFCFLVFVFCFSLRTKGSFKKAAYLLESCWDKRRT